MSEQKYVIKWRSNITGREGEGTGEFSLEKANLNAYTLNAQDENKNAGLFFWPEAVTNGEQKAAKETELHG